MRTAAFVDESLHAFIIVHLSRNQDIEIIRQADQAAIKHPVRGSGQRDAIAEDIRATILHGPDMSGVNLGAATSIDEFQPCYRAALIIGPKNNAPEHAVAHGTAREHRDTLTPGFERVGGLILGKTREQVIHANARQHRGLLIEPAFNNPQKIG